jgi:hypothetical protein
LSAEIKQERSRQLLAITTGLLSKSADSDTLVVDLMVDHSHGGEDKDKGNTEVETTQGEDFESDVVKDKDTEVEETGLFIDCLI